MYTPPLPTPGPSSPKAFLCLTEKTSGQVTDLIPSASLTQTPGNVTEYALPTASPPGCATDGPCQATCLTMTPGYVTDYVKLPGLTMTPGYVTETMPKRQPNDTRPRHRRTMPSNLPDNDARLCHGLCQTARPDNDKLCHRNYAKAPTR